MTIREELEWTEHLCLSERAQFSDATRGRLRPEEPQENDVRTCYQRDSDRILHSKSFRRLMHKTQVFLQPEGDHYRTRMTHTLEVARIARTITRALRLNEDLAEAIAFGHDLGHTPFGHAGEVALTEVMGEPFRHNEQSLRVVDVLEKDGQGLNLTYEVRMGILGHSSHSRMPETLEGQIIRKSDQIAYINHDIDDAMRAGILTNDDIPREISDVLGETHRERINTLVTDMIFHSRGTGELGMTPEIEQRPCRPCASSCLSASTRIRSPKARNPRPAASCRSFIPITSPIPRRCRRGFPAAAHVRGGFRASCAIISRA